MKKFLSQKNLVKFYYFESEMWEIYLPTFVGSGAHIIWARHAARAESNRLGRSWSNRFVCAAHGDHPFILRMSNRTKQSRLFRVWTG